MVNRYAPWRYFLLVLIIVVGAIYAAPNLYGEDPAVQISHRVNLVDEGELGLVKGLIDAENLAYRSIELDGENILVRFESEEVQLRAAAQIKRILEASDSRYTVALNLAPATPDWLTALNALPMYLGLDLRGGVHFLMEVDMDSAISKSLVTCASSFSTQAVQRKVIYSKPYSVNSNSQIRGLPAADRATTSQQTASIRNARIQAPRIINALSR